MEEHGSKLRTCQEQDKARNMLRKAINHVIKTKRVRQMLEKDLESQGCGQQLKSYIHTPKLQIQSVEPRRRRLGIRTIPCIFGEKGRIKRLRCVFVFEREEKCVDNVQEEIKTQKNNLLWSGGCPGPFIAPTRFTRRWPFKGCHLQMALNQVYLDTPGIILTSCF